MNWFDVNNIGWLIPIPPFIACALILLVLGRNKLLSHSAAMIGIILSWAMSWGAVWYIVNNYKGLGPATDVFRSNTTTIFGQAWLANGAGIPGLDGSGALNMGVMIDPLTTVMLFMVPLACMLIFIYAIGYMANDARQTRFFAYLSLFAGAMLTLVVADNLLLLFVGWEIMGLCSYLLIGFWYEKKSAYRAAMKAFITTRVADVIMMIGIAYLWSVTGTLSFREIMHNEEVLHMLGTVQPGAILGVSAATIIGICIVIGTMGKSAQFPFHVWLPDAMEGPTPVSAMIHAAAMVSAGVYLVIRMFPVISAGSNLEAGLFTPPVMLMGVVGSFTALFAATIAVSQNDIKKVLAYSTISQLGFMIAALGIGAYVAAAFHLITHAFFKALLFLGSGSVIHAMEHGHHHVEHEHGHGHGTDAAHDIHPYDETPAHAEHADDAHAIVHEHGDTEVAHIDEDEVPEFDPQDMRNMGGLIRRIPVTAITFIIGGAALAGFPFITAGFWSKDEIFLDAVDKLGATPLAFLVLICLGMAAILTAFYTFRQIWMTFFGEPRTEAAKHAILNDGTTAGRNISAQLQAPLVALSIFAVFAGFAGVHPDFPILGPMVNGILKSLRVGSQPFGNFVGRTLLEQPHHPEFNGWAPIISLTVFTVGVVLGWLLYARRPIEYGQSDAVEGIVGSRFYRVLQNKYYIDELYAMVLIRPFQWFADKVVGPILDQGIIDGVLHAVARGATWFGELCREFNRVVIDGVGDGIPMAIADIARQLRALQTGRIQQYLLYTLIAAIVIGLNVIVVVAAPGIVGYFGIVEAGIVVILVFFFGSNPRNSEQ
ncbi:MAG: NADH-quinone oxidoreductase subunit L [Anaerolineae bacterium]